MVMNDLLRGPWTIKKILSWATLFSLLLLSVAVVYSGIETTEFSYTIQATPALEQEYVLYLPLPVHSYDMEVLSGELSHKTVDSEHGRALKITSSEEFVLEFTGKELEYKFKHTVWDDYHTFTTQEDINGDGSIGREDDFWCWFFFDNLSSENTLELSLVFDMEFARNTIHVVDGHCNTTTELSGGWELVEYYNEYSDGHAPLILTPICCSINIIIFLFIMIFILKSSFKQS